MENPTEIATIPANMTNFTYTISSQQDTSSTSGGEVVITLIASSATPATYVIPTQTTETKVTFTVSHYEPTISIYAAGTTDQTKTIREGELISVDVTRSATATTALNVTIMTMETTGNSYANILKSSLEISQVVIIPANMATFTFTITSQQDTSSTNNGEVIITVV